MSYGLTEAGIDVVAGIDNDPRCRDTYESNLDASFVCRDVMELELDELRSVTGLCRDDDNLILAGCSPCQYYTKIRTDKTKAARKKNLLQRFGEFIKHYRPGYLVVENVPGILSNRNASVVNGFRGLLHELGYSFEDGVVDVKNYGVPQKRRRYLLIATRLAGHLALPRTFETEKGTNVRDHIGDETEFPRLEAGHRDDSPSMHIVSGLSELNLRRIRKTTKDGGTRHDWAKDPELQIPAYEGQDDGYFPDVYGRMKWDEPAPTITTKFNSLSNGRFGHPEQDRAISLREGATLQTFPTDFVFHGGLQGIARQIGNAVPPLLAKALGMAMVKHRKNTRPLEGAEAATRARGTVPAP
jgi:DNA (cytosine-5)-methyltransferase 1